MVPKHSDLGQNLDIDENFETESLAADSFNTDTTSLSSTVFNYEYENGRRYHSFRSGKYVMPNDQTEQERMDMVHHCWSLFLHGKLTLVPEESCKKFERVLDVGTGTGIWAIDFGDEYSNAEVTGIDLSPIQPRWVPPNVKFEVDDVELDWTFPENHFDFIHFRSMAGSFRDWKGVMKKTFKHLKPGGWIEIRDVDISQLCSDDGSVKPGSALDTYYDLLWKSFEKVGLATHVDSYGEYIHEAGFEQVNIMKSKFPLGQWPKSKYQKELGHWGLEISKLGFEGYALKLFTGVMGMSNEEAGDLIQRCIKEAADKSLHSYWKTYTVLARKPLSC